MSIGVRTENLRKVFTSPPPVAAQRGGFGPTARRAVPRGAGPGGDGAAAAGRRGSRQGRGKQRYEIVALADLSLAVEAGEIFGLLGPNGAGKSTTVGILTTRIEPTSGRAFVGEHEVSQDPVAVKRHIGVVSQRPNLDFSLTAREILLFHAAYFSVPSAERKRRADQMLEQFQLTDRANELVRGFSGGMAQRLSIARALMHDPQVLFLDEPSAGLDPQTRLLLWEIVREYNRRGKTILVTTHNMEEADALCDRIAIIDHGGIITQGTPQELKASVPGGYLIRLRFDHVGEAVVNRLESLAGVREVQTVDNGSVLVYADRGGTLVPEIAGLAAATGAALSDVHISEPSLENLFLHHTGRSLRE